MTWNRHAIEPTRSRGQRRAEGVDRGRGIATPSRRRSPNFDFPRRHEGLPIKRGRRLLVCVFATKKKRAGGPRAAETTACECRPGPGCSVDASDVEDPCSRPPEPTSCADPCKSMDGAEVGASECACAVS